MCRQFDMPLMRWLFGILFAISLSAFSAFADSAHVRYSLISDIDISDLEEIDMDALCEFVVDVETLRKVMNRIAGGAEKGTYRTGSTFLEVRRGQSIMFRMNAFREFETHDLSVHVVDDRIFEYIHGFFDGLAVSNSCSSFIQEPEVAAPPVAE